MRLQKYLAAAGVASRRACERLIAEGRVTVNGVTVREMGVQVDETRDRVCVGGKPVRPATEMHYIAYHKPLGEVTTVSDPEGRATVMDKFRDYLVRLFPVGRLDYDSEGLLLLTNDGEMMQRLLHPSREVPKQYLCRVNGRVTPEELRTLRTGVTIEGRLTSPADARLVRFEGDNSVLLITIHEGRNRQVRRMAEAVGHEVTALRRVGFGPIRLEDLPRGMWRRLTPEEIRRLKELK